MNKRIQKLWIEALRSGEYVQTDGMLRDGKGFCCLGVLCDLAAKAGIGRWQHDYFYAGNECSSNFLISDVCNWAGIKHRRFFGITPEGNVSLVQLNDQLEHTFDEIADIIQIAGDEL